MGHPVPKELHGEERYFSIPYLNIHFNKKGVIYCGVASLISWAIGKVTNIWVFAVLFIILNIIAYHLGQGKTAKNKFEGGNVPYDIYYLRQFKYKYFNQNIYIRKRGD